MLVNINLYENILCVFVWKLSHLARYYPLDIIPPTPKVELVAQVLQKLEHKQDR